MYNVLLYGYNGTLARREQYTNKREALRAAAGDAREIGARRVTPWASDELARWHTPNASAGVVVWRETGGA